MWRKLAKISLVLLCFFAILGSVSRLFFWYYFEYKTNDLPNVETLRDYNFNLSTTVLDNKGKIINTFAVEDRIYIPYENISQNVINAVISAEDKKFFYKRLIPGIDHEGTARAVWKNLLARKIVAGGSTITQQVGRNVWLSNDRTFSRKFKEARLAYRMEKHLPKELIFEIYINLVYFGHGKYGIVTASDFYFGKKPNELTVDEAAMLAGLIKWPYQFSPIEKPKSAQNRRNSILERMHKNNFIGAEELKELKSKSLGLNVKNAKIKAPYLSSFIMKKLYHLGYEKVVNQGLDVRLSLNSDFQQIAEMAFQRDLAAYEERHKKRMVLYNIFLDYKMKSLNDFKSDSWDGDIGLESVVDGLILEVGLSSAIAKVGEEKVIITIESFSKIRQDVTDFNKVFKVGDVVSLKITGVDGENNFTAEILQPEVQGAVVVLDVETGGIKAIIGGRNFESSKYNRAMQAERQAGSAFKPFVYGAYFENYPDKNLETQISDEKICFKTGNPEEPLWCPKNYEEKSLPPFMKSISVKTAIARSRNVATVRVANDMGIEKVIELARKLGVTSEIPPYLPTAIGAADVKVIELANAYAAFFRGGIYKPYWFLKSVEDRKYGFRDFEPKESKQALSAEAANKVLEGMRWVVLAGTAHSAMKDLTKEFAVACKTGTTNNFTDAWILCGTPRYLVAVWIGFDRKAIPLVSRESSAKETGGSAAAPIAAEILKEIYKNRPYDLFPEEMENRILGIKKSELKPAEKPEPEKTITPE